MKKRVVIVGGGISGLSAAHCLCEFKRERKLDWDITVLEAGNRFGGVIETKMDNGFLFEDGPDCFLSEKPWAVDLCKRIGLAQELIETRKEARRSFICRNGKLVPVPKGFYLTVPSEMSSFFATPLFSWRGKQRMACEMFIPARTEERDESVAAFIRRRFGREALERAGQPMIAGIYTGDAEKLSLAATLPRFRAMERDHGSLIRAVREREASGPRYHLFLSLRGGIGMMVQALVRAMPEAALRTRAAVSKISRDGVLWNVELAGGGVLPAEAVCVAVPAPAAAVLLKEIAPDAASGLLQIPYESVATVNLVYRKDDVAVQPGFGFVVPAVEKRKIVGCTFSNIKFPWRCPDDFLLIRAFVGGPGGRELIGLEDQALEDLVKQELREILGIEKDPVQSSICRLPHSMPQYEVGHLERVQKIETAVNRLPGLYVTGNAFRGVGIPDCIHAAEQTAEEIYRALR